MEEVFLDNSNFANIRKIKKLSYSDLKELSYEIRNFLIQTISKTGGHIGANLGTIEITIALHKVFNSPHDKIIFDTGHQGYTHKIITGRKNKFKYLNKYKKGFSRFLDRRESVHDIIDSSHAGTSIAIGSGLALNIKKIKSTRKVITVIGDGSLVEGIAFESLNYVSDKKLPLLIVLNDNGYAIDKNVGGIKYMTSGKNWIQKSKNFFESLGLNYIYEQDGHNIKKLCQKLKKIKKLDRTTIFHIKSTKGNGLEIAKTHPYKLHFSMPFNPQNGLGISSTLQGKSYASEIANEIDKYLSYKKKKDLFVLTPATPYSNHLQDILLKYPKNILDVGMAEQHAAGMAAGIGLGKNKVVLCYQSTFMQRAFDQLFHDIAYMKLPVTIVSSRSGFAGFDSSTHHALMDLSYLRIIPNLEVYYPSNLKDCVNKFRERIYKKIKNPLVILHQYEPVDKEYEPVDIANDYDFFLKESKKNLIITTGNYIPRAFRINELLNKKSIKISLLCIKQIKPASTKLKNIIKPYKNISVIEENNLIGGLGSMILDINNSNPIIKKILLFGIQDKFIEPGSNLNCSKEANIDPKFIFNKLKNIF